LIAPQVLFLERPTDNTIEIAVDFTREVGAFLQENTTKANATVFIGFCAVLNERSITHCTQHITGLFMQVRKDKDKDKDSSI